MNDTKTPDRIKVVKTLKRVRDRRDYQKAYNKVRNARYQNDPEYRAKVIEQERVRYRRRVGGEPNDFGGNAGKARNFATSLKVTTTDDRTITMAVLSVNDMATFLNTTSKVLCSWIRKGRFPEPNKRSKCGKRIYTIAEANSLAAVFDEHMKGRAALCSTDDGVIELLHDVYQAHQD